MKRRFALLSGIPGPCMAIALSMLLLASAAVADPPIAVDRADKLIPTGSKNDDASAPRSWELSPYRVQLLIRVNLAPGWTDARRRDFATDIVARSQALIGGIWQLSVADAPAAFPWRQAVEPVGMAAESLPANSVDFDKLILLDAAPDFATTRLWAREFDVRTRLWSPPQVQSIAATADLTQAAVRGLWSVFRPVAKIESVPVVDGPQETVIRVLGGDLPSVGHGLDLVRAGSLWQPLIRHTDAAGHTLAKGVYPVPFTWLQTLRANGSLAPCRAVSATSDPIDLHYDGRTEYLALAVNARSSHGTELTVLSDGAGDHPLEDLEVQAREGDGPLKTVGRTDVNGRLLISTDALTLVTVFIRSGDDLLLRLPLVCGVEPAVTVRAEDNGRRAVSARLVEIASAKLLDLAAQQRILGARLQRQLVGGKNEEAAASMAALSSLPSSEKFTSGLDSQRAAMVDLANDPTAAAWLDKQLASIKALATQNLIDAGTLAKLHEAVNSAGK